MTGTSELSLILPCYNEAGILEQSVQEILSTLDSAAIRHEILFVDDASRDGTTQVIRRILRANPERSMRLITHSVNRGRGRCVTEGIRSAVAPLVGFLDVDLETHCRHIPRAMDRLREGADLVVASRRPRVDWKSLHRQVLSRGYNRLVRSLLRLPYCDTEAGFKFFRRDRILPILGQIEASGWFWDTEVVALCHHADFRIEEMACPFVRRSDHPSTVRPVRDSLAYLRSLIRFRRRLWREAVEAAAGATSAPVSLVWGRPGWSQDDMRTS
ncbi:MAG: glycosyltransferase [Planctomycetota bacterium]|nr:glycosyltransferase [Planctomycetota bacterium]